MESGRVVQQYGNGAFEYIDPDGNAVESDWGDKEKVKEILCGVAIESGEKAVKLNFKKGDTVVATMDVTDVPVQALEEKTNN